MISVRQGSRRLGNGDRAERRACHHFSAVHSLEAQQFNPLAHRRSHEFVTGSYSLEHHVSARMARRRLLRPRESSAHNQRHAESQTHAYSLIHSSFPSFLPNFQNFFVPLYCCGNRTACGSPSSPTSKSTWIHSPARSSFTGRPSAPSAPRCIRTRTIAASSASADKAPGSRVKFRNSLSATSVPAESEFAEPSCGTWRSFFKFASFVFAPAFCAGASAEFCGATRCLAASSCWLFRQLLQLTALAKTAAAASAHAAITATRCVFIVPCCVRNSCRKRISTRAGVSAAAVESAKACSSTRAACQESCSAAQREHTLACSRAAAPSSSLSDASRSAPSPMASNSSHFIAHFHFSSSSRHARAPRHVAQHLKLRQQQRAPAMQPRSNRPDRTSGRLRRFFVAQLFQFAQHHRFAKLRRQFQHRGANLLHPLARFRPSCRSRRIPQYNSRAASVLVFLFQRNFPRQSLQMLHHAVSRNSVQVSAKRSAARIVFLRSAHQSHENVLYNFFSGPRASGHAQREAVHRRLVPLVQESERLFLALGGPPQQNVVSRWLSDPHLSWLDVLKPFKGYIPRPAAKSSRRLWLAGG